MTWDKVQNDWAKYRDSVKSHWSKLTDADLDAINGDRGALEAKLVNAYGITAADASKGVNDWLASQK